MVKILKISTYIIYPQKITYGIKNLLKKISEKLEEKTSYENILISRERHANVYWISLKSLRKIKK